MRPRRGPFVLSTGKKRRKNATAPGAVRRFKSDTVGLGELRGFAGMFIPSFNFIYWIFFVQFSFILFHRPTIFVSSYCRLCLFTRVSLTLIEVTAPDNRLSVRLFHGRRFAVFDKFSTEIKHLIFTFFFVHLSTAVFYVGALICLHTSNDFFF